MKGRVGCLLLLLLAVADAASAQGKPEKEKSSQRLCSPSRSPFHTLPGGTSRALP